MVREKIMRADGMDAATQAMKRASAAIRSFGKAFAAIVEGPAWKALAKLSASIERRSARARRQDRRRLRAEAATFQPWRRRGYRRPAHRANQRFSHRQIGRKKKRF